MIERLRTGDIVLDGDVIPAADHLPDDHWSLQETEIQPETLDPIGDEIEAIEAEIEEINQLLVRDNERYDAKLERIIRDDINGAMAALSLRQDGIFPPDEVFAPRLDTLHRRLLLLTDHRNQLVDALAKISKDPELSDHEKHSQTLRLEGLYRSWATEQATRSVAKKKTVQ